MNEITWNKQPFTVGLLRYTGGKEEKYDELVSMNIADEGVL